MPEITYREAVCKALADEMALDPDVVFFGEDVAESGGVFKVTLGLYERFGPERVRDTPISEQAIIGMALGAAITGLRPVAELMFADFVPVALDQIANQVAKYRYMSGGQFRVPLTIRAAQGGGNGFGTQHSQCAESWLMSFPGLKVVSPSTPLDMYGLLRGAIQENNPVVVLEHKGLYNLKGDVPEGTQAMPLGKAQIVRPGKHITVVASQLMLHRSLEAAAILMTEGIECEVIDVRSFAPLDTGTILRSVKKTNRMVIVEEAPHGAGWGGDVASLAVDEGLFWLECPVKRINMGNALIAYSPPLEDAALPNVERICQSIRDVMAS
jgi:pyruvate dehydrogenase E1 component beta subunit